jgi:hypothetical protein
MEVNAYAAHAGDRPLESMDITRRVPLDSSVGDITCYAPWGRLAIFHGDFDYSRGVVHLATMDAPAEALLTPIESRP